MGQETSVLTRSASSGTLGIPAEAAALREKASDAFQRRNDAFAKSKACYAKGDHSGAKNYSQQGKQWAERAQEWNRNAAALIFADNNRQRRQSVEMDLHGLFVAEAQSMVEQRIDWLMRERRKELVDAGGTFTIIVGKGQHSENGVARIKPAVLRSLEQRYGLLCQVDPGNAGCLNVTFQPTAAAGPSLLRRLLSKLRRWLSP